MIVGSRGPAVLDDFTSSYGYRFADAAGYQWPQYGGNGEGNDEDNTKENKL